MIDLYDTLGVTKDADAATIKRAYRKRVAKTHPDKGGDAREFHELTVAYDVLTNDERRKKYDQTGETKQEDEAAVLQNELIQLILTAIKSTPDLKRQNPLEIARQFIGNRQKEITDNKLGILREMKSFSIAIKKLRRKKTMKNDLVIMAMERHLKKGEQDLANLNSQLDRAERLKAMVNDYEYDVDIIPASFTFTTSTIR